MSTCAGCHGDARVPHDAGLVLVVIGYQDGGADDPLVWHAAPTWCAHGDRPHRMSQCGEFEPPRPGFAPDADPPRSTAARSGSKLMHWSDWGRYFEAIVRERGDSDPSDPNE